MRILFFAPRKCWPLNSGARLRDYHLARQLARRARVTFVGLCYPEQEAFASDDVGLPQPEEVFERVITISRARPYGLLNVVRGFLGSTPVTVLNWTVPEVVGQLAELGRNERFDAIHLVGIHLLRYVPVLRGFPGQPPILCDWHDIQSEKMWRYSEAIGGLRRLYARRTAKLLEVAELELLRSCSAHTVVSDRDRTSLILRAPKASIEVIGNGVDTAYFARTQDFTVLASRILFVGAMDYAPNEEAVTWFAQHIWAPTLQRFPDLRFCIVGRKPTPEVLALNSLPGIEVTGTVPDVRPYYDGALAMVVPLHWGSGTRLKILEAMAAGVPVISTTLGAEGLEATHKENILIADSPSEMSAAITLLRESPDWRERLAKAGRFFAASRYDWASAGERLLSIYAGLARES